MNVVAPDIRELVEVIEGPSMDARLVKISKDLYTQDHYVDFVMRDTGLTICRMYASYEKAVNSGRGWLDGTYNPEQ